MESRAVNNKLNSLQSARRDFLMAIANVSSNAVNLLDNGANASTIDECAYQVEFPESPRVHNIPDIDQDEQFRPRYHVDHPDVQAARQHLQQGRNREARRRLDEEFDAIMADEQEILDDINAFPCSPLSPPPKQTGSCDYARPFNPAALEKFFDLDAFPPGPQTACPPPGREGLPPDLWDLEDPWCNLSAAQQDLMEQNLMEFST